MYSSEAVEVTGFGDIAVVEQKRSIIPQPDWDRYMAAVHEAPQLHGILVVSDVGAQLTRSQISDILRLYRRRKPRYVVFASLRVTRVMLSIIRKLGVPVHGVDDGDINAALVCLERTNLMLAVMEHLGAERSVRA